MCKLFCEGFFREAGKDVYQKIKKTTNEILHKPFNPKIEIILVIIMLVFLLLTIIFLFWGEFIYNGTLYVTICDIDPNYNGTPVYQKNCWISAGLVCFVFFLLFLIEVVVVVYEKRENRKLFNRQVMDMAREESRLNSLFPLKLYKTLDEYISNIAASKVENIFAENNAESIKRNLDKLKNDWMTQYDTICSTVIDFIDDHIQNVCDQNLVINVSIKAFFNNPKCTNDPYIITLGRCMHNSHDDKRKGRKKSKRISWEHLFEHAHRVSEDYAFSQILSADSTEYLFRCGDVAVLKEKLQHVGNVSNTCQYKTYSDRKFVATLVCPVLRSNISDNTSVIIGAICIDLNQQYLDWDSAESYEENIIRVTAQLIEPLISHNMNEACDAYNRYQQLTE